MNVMILKALVSEMQDIQVIAPHIELVLNLSPMDFAQISEITAKGKLDLIQNSVKVRCLDRVNNNDALVQQIETKWDSYFKTPKEIVVKEWKLL